MNPRRDDRLSSASTARSFASIAARRAASSSSGVGSGAGGDASTPLDSSTTPSSSLTGYLTRLGADHHCSKIVPPGSNHLGDVNDEEHDVPNRKPEMKEARGRI